MPLDINLDVNIARIVHLQWEQQLENLVQDADAQGVSLSSHEDCDLGIWIYGIGLQKYAQRQEIWALKEVHKAFHQAADEVARSVAAGKHALAQDAMLRVRELSRDIIYRLTAMELAIFESQRRTPRQFLQQLGGGRGTDLRMVQLVDAKGLRYFRRRKQRLGAMLLNVNVARLTHMRWTRALEQSFRKRGRNLPPQGAEECELGVWLHSADLKPYQDRPSFVQLDEVHKRFHQLSARTIAALNRHHYPEADNHYEQVKQLSRDVVFLLTRIEMEIEHAPSLLQRLFWRS
jgi:hypothetical protein